MFTVRRLEQEIVLTLVITPQTQKKLGLVDSWGREFPHSSEDKGTEALEPPQGPQDPNKEHCCGRSSTTPPILYCVAIKFARQLRDHMKIHEYCDPEAEVYMISPAPE